MIPLIVQFTIFVAVLAAPIEPLWFKVSLNFLVGFVMGWLLQAYRQERREAA